MIRNLHWIFHQHLYIRRGSEQSYPFPRFSSFWFASCCCVYSLLEEHSTKMVFHWQQFRYHPCSCDYLLVCVFCLVASKTSFRCTWFATSRARLPKRALGSERIPFWMLEIVAARWIDPKETCVATRKCWMDPVRALRILDTTRATYRWKKQHWSCAQRIPS